MGEITTKFLVDLNLTTLKENMESFAAVRESIDGVKLGETLIHHGLGIQVMSRISRFQEGVIGYDGKFAGTPDTTVPIVETLSDYGVAFFTASIKAEHPTFEALARMKKGMKLLAVTHLTSCEVSDEELIHATQNVLDWGADGVVCAPPNASLLRAHFPDAVLLVTAVRREGDSHNDHKRAGTITDVVRARADYFVMGRPITGAADPQFAARGVRETLQSVQHEFTHV